MELCCWISSKGHTLTTCNDWPGECLWKSPRRKPRKTVNISLHLRAKAHWSFCNLAILPNLVQAIGKLNSKENWSSLSYCDRLTAFVSPCRVPVSEDHDKESRGSNMPSCKSTFTEKPPSSFSTATAICTMILPDFYDLVLFGPRFRLIVENALLIWGAKNCSLLLTAILYVGGVFAGN